MVNVNSKFWVSYIYILLILFDNQQDVLLIAFIANIVFKRLSVLKDNKCY